MSIITKESIADTIEGLEQLVNRGIQSVYIDMAIAGMRRLLASLEAEAVAEVCEGFTLRYIGHGPAPKSGVRIGDRLYTAPPAPVAVPDFGALTKCIVQRLVDYGAADDDAIARAEEFVYNACRAVMLNQEKSNG